MKLTKTSLQKLILEESQKLLKEVVPVMGATFGPTATHAAAWSAINSLMFELGTLSEHSFEDDSTAGTRKLTPGAKGANFAINALKQMGCRDVESTGPGGDLHINSQCDREHVVATLDKTDPNFLKIYTSANVLLMYTKTKEFKNLASVKRALKNPNKDPDVGGSATVGKIATQTMEGVQSELTNLLRMVSDPKGLKKGQPGDKVNVHRRDMETLYGSSQSIGDVVKYGKDQSTQRQLSPGAVDPGGHWMWLYHVLKSGSTKRKTDSGGPEAAAPGTSKILGVPTLEEGKKPKRRTKAKKLNESPVRGRGSRTDGSHGHWPDGEVEQWNANDMAFALDFLVSNLLRVQKAIAARANKEPDFHPSRLSIPSWSKFQHAVKNLIQATFSKKHDRARRRLGGRPEAGWATKKSQEKSRRSGDAIRAPRPAGPPTAGT